MARIGLKVYYLRTRILTVSQAELATGLGVRQATVSHIERGRSEPNAALILELCRYFDVSPSYLLDPERGLELRPTDRWTLRNALVTVGMWVELPRKSLELLADDQVLAPILPDEDYYDEDARLVVSGLKTRSARRRKVRAMLESEKERNRRLEKEVAKELQVHPKRRKG